MYDAQSSSLRKSVKNAHALIAHTRGMMIPIKSKLQWVRMSLVLRKSIFYSYVHNKGTDQTVGPRIDTLNDEIWIPVVRQLKK